MDKAIKSPGTLTWAEILGLAADCFWGILIKAQVDVPFDFMGSPNPYWCIWVSYRPIMPKNSQKSAFCGTSFCPILAILAPQKQSAAKPNISAQVIVPGDFLALSNPYWCIWVSYRPIMPKNSQKSAFCGTSFCPLLAILAPQKQSAARPNISAQGNTPGLIWLYPTLIDVFDYTRGQ